MVAKIAYKSEMYLIKSDGTEVLIGHVEWDQEAEAMDKADGIYVMMAMSDAEEALINRLLKFKHYRSNENGQ